jgi:7,8-dihydroneopterin aldolase/epimerase/oxygenase
VIRRAGKTAPSSGGGAADVEITLRAMRFHGLVGILPHERDIPQPIEIDLTVTVAPGEGVIDYRELYVLAANAVVGQTSFLEGLAGRVAKAALDHSPRIRTARVAVRKPHVALPGPLAHAEVVVERRADA